mgnify:CR=1 FL=1
MKSPLFKNVREITPKEGIRLNRRVVVFLICLMVSAFLWVVQTLSQNYAVEIYFPVEYHNLPKDKVVANPLPQNIQASVKISGFNYLIYKIFHRNKIVFIDAKRLKKSHERNNYYILPNSKIETISNQFNEDIEILKIEPDTIFFNFNKKISKQVRVKTNIAISYEENYQPTDSLTLSPKTITISGAKEIVEKIKFVETKPIVLKNVKNDVSLTLSILSSPQLKLVEITPDIVKATMHVTKFTEAVIELPLDFVNVPKRYSIKTFPDKINVKYNVSLENYEKIKPSDFIAVVDYSKVSKGSNKLKVELKKFPKEIHSLKISPQKVEFIIRK